MNSTEIQPEAFSPREVVKLMRPKTSERKVRRAIKLGELTAYESGARQYILRADFIEWIKRQGKSK
jgi:hypothetical protein